MSKNGRPYVIRPSAPADCPAFADLLNNVAAEREWLVARQGDGSVLEETVALAALLGSGGLSLSLEVGAAVAGRCTVQLGRPPHESHAGELAVVVAADCRDEGMGSALVAAGIDWSREAGLVRLALRVFITNRRAIAVYRAAGFDEEGVLRRAVLMPEGYRDLMVMSLML